MKTRLFARSLVAAALAASVATASLPAAAHPTDPSAASAASALSLALPIAVSVAAPVMLLSAGATLTLVSVQASAAGTVWVLERASDGARISIEFAGRAAEASVVGIAEAVAVTALSTGWLLSAAGQAIAFIPNQVGMALMYNERLTR